MGWKRKVLVLANVTSTSRALLELLAEQASRRAGGERRSMIAVAEAWDPMAYDEIIVSTLPMSVSKWLRADLPRRIERHTGGLVQHVIAQPPKLGPKIVRVPESERRGSMGPFSVLTWGARPSEPR